MLIGVGAGYRFSENFRSDVTYVYRGGYEISDHDGAGNAISTNIKSNSMFLNGYFDFPSRWPRLMPYIGGGVGWAKNQLGTVSYARTSINGGTTNNFAWNAGVGFGFQISKGMILDVGYRYVDLGKLKLDTQPALGFAEYSASGQFRSNELQLGLRF
jgi:opacity protein-like surface antigen